MVSENRSEYTLESSLTECKELIHVTESISVQHPVVHVSNANSEFVKKNAEEHYCVHTP